jgi:hypothetical protein
MKSMLTVWERNEDQKAWAKSLQHGLLVAIVRPTQHCVLLRIGPLYRVAQESCLGTVLNASEWIFAFEVLAALCYWRSQK